MSKIAKLDVNGAQHYSITLGDSIILQKIEFLIGDRQISGDQKLSDQEIAIIQLCDRVLELEEKIEAVTEYNI